MGTAAVSDISNTLTTLRAVGRQRPRWRRVLRDHRVQSPGSGGAGQPCPGDDGGAGIGERPTSLAAHAPYSVAPAVFRAIAAAVERAGLSTCSVHLSESAAEVEFMRTGAGPWRTLLEDLGVWNSAWVAPGVSPVQYLDDQGFLTSRAMAVHGVQMTAADLLRLAERRATLVACPRSNAYTGAGTPPIEAFYTSGVDVAIGTDSLASTADLNVFSELALMRTLAPGVPASMLLDSATRQGARALGLDTDLGTIAPGKRARLISVKVPPRIDDVEEYLVSGVDPEQIAWLPQ